jgi:hypothetical protein
LPQSEQLALHSSGDPIAWILFTNATYGKWDGGQQHTREFTVMRAFGARGFEETWSDGPARIAEQNPELSPEQDIYGIVLRALAVGLPYIGIYGSDLAIAADNDQFQQAFTFGNRHAGWHRFPRSAPGAWLVLGRFEGTTDWRRLQTLAQDNWGYFLRQNDPSATSTPVALVGDPSSRFGLTARQLDATATFDVDDAFAEIIAGEEVELRVTYLESSGAISVQVDQGGALADVAEDHHDDDRGWRVASYLLAGPSLTGGTDGRTDLAIAVAAGAPVIHRIEIERTGAAVVDPDGGVPSDGGSGTTPPGGSEAEESSGCGACATSRGHRTADGLLVALLLAGLLRRRRRIC